MYFLKLLGLFFLSVVFLVLLMFVLKFIMLLSSFLFGFEFKHPFLDVLFLSLILIGCFSGLYEIYEAYQHKKGDKK